MLVDTAPSLVPCFVPFHFVAFVLGVAITVVDHANAF